MRITLKKFTSILFIILMAFVMAFCAVACGGDGDDENPDENPPIVNPDDPTEPDNDNPAPVDPVNPFDPVEPDDSTDPDDTTDPDNTVPDNDTDLDDTNTPSNPDDNPGDTDTPSNPDDNPDDTDTPSNPDENPDDTDTPSNPDEPTDTTAPTITVNNLTLNGIKGDMVTVAYGTDFVIDDNTATLVVKLFKPGDTTGVTVVAGADKSISFTPDTLGEYTLKIIAKDEAGNESSEKAITVSVTEDVKPVITVTNAEVLNWLKDEKFSLVFGTDFNVEDESEVTITALLTKPDTTTEDISFIENKLSFIPSIVGVYTLKISAVDEFDNVADDVTVTITVIDHNAPVITLTQDEVNHVLGSAFTITLGTDFTVVDEGEIDISAILTKPDTTTEDLNLVSNAFSFTPDVLGEYTITINAEDTDGNVAIQKTLTVNVIETDKPVISVTNETINNALVDSNVTITFGADFTVTDASEYTISGTIAYESEEAVDINYTENKFSFTPENTGKYTITINAIDKFDNEAIAKTIIVNVIENVKPNVTINNATVSVIKGNVVEYVFGTDFNVTDDSDYVITGTIAKASEQATSIDYLNDKFTFTPDTTGTYTLTIIVTDEFDNLEEKTVTINVTENVKPVIAVVNGTISNKEMGVAVAVTLDTDFTVTDESEVTITAELVKPDTTKEGLTLVSNMFSFTPNKAGTYTLNISATDEFGNVADVKTITINVIEKVNPVIELYRTTASATTTSNVSIAYGTDYMVTDDSNYTITAVLNGNGLTNNNISVASDKSITFKVELAGTYTLSIIATDEYANTSSRDITITIKNPRPTFYDESGFTGTTNQYSLKLESDSFITIDGKLDESCYASQNWFTYTYEGVQVSVTTVFGEKGFYVAFKVLDPHVYALESRSVWMGSSVEMYIERYGVDNKSAQSVQYRLSALDVVEMLKGVETIEDKWKWTYRPIYGLTEVIGGELNSGYTEGLNAEIFVRWDALGYDMDSSSFTVPDRVKIMPVYNQSSGAKTDSQREYWVNNGGEINDPRDYWVFDDTGYVNADKDLAEVGDAEFGRAKTAGWDLTKVLDKEVSTNIDANKQAIYFKGINDTNYVFTTLVQFNGKGSYSYNPKAGIILAGNETTQSFLIDYSKTTTATAQGFTFNAGNPDPKELWTFSSAYKLDTLNIDPLQPIRLTGIKVGKYLMIFVGDANTPRYGGTLVTQIEDNVLSGNATPGLMTIDCFATFTDFEASNDPATIAKYTSGVFSVLTLDNQTGGDLTSSATGYAYNTTAKVQIQSTSGYELSSIKVGYKNADDEVVGLVEKINEIVDGELSIYMDKDEIVVQPTWIASTATNKGQLTATVTGKDNFCTYADITYLLTDGKTFTRGKLTTASLLRARNVPYGEYELIFYVNGLLNSRQTVTMNASTVALGDIILEQKIPVGDGSGAGVTLPSGATYNEADQSISMPAKTNFLMYKYSGGFQFGISLARNDGEKEVSGTWGTGGLAVLSGGNMYRIFVMRENENDIVVYINNETNWAQAEYRQGGTTWGTGAPISFDIAFCNGEIRLVINKSVQYVLTKTNAKGYDGVEYTVPSELNYLFDHSGEREVGICAIDVDITFRNITSSAITEMPSLFTNTATQFTDNSWTAKIDDSTIGIAQGQSKFFASSGTTPVSTTDDYMVSFTAYRADFYEQEGTWDTFGLHLNIGGTAYRLFFMRENYGTVVIYLTGSGADKEYRLNAELRGTGAEQTLTFVFDVSEGVLHISWAGYHIKLDSTTLGGTENSAIFSNQSKQLGVFANVSSVFKNLTYSTDATVINDALSTFPSNVPTIKA